MKFNSTIPVIAACLAMGGASFAVAGEKQAGASAKSYGAGTAAAGRDGAVARGVNGSDASTTARDRRDRRGSREEGVNSATTHGSGAVYTTRRGASAAVTTGGSASGRGVQSTGSTVDAYAETNRDGSNADVYGDSVATSGERPK
ncbi:hypothetical protein [Phenylobacterium sp.]|uniref:hypothetical protein n=1 Tax=Phenylobacterium sp. TaxID=1871053 RepID=UPI00286C1AC0|nr:hypothetical protein [Phenylobacterium sp.]